MENIDHMINSPEFYNRSGLTILNLSPITTSSDIDSSPKLMTKSGILRKRSPETQVSRGPGKRIRFSDLESVQKESGFSAEVRLFISDTVFDTFGVNHNKDIGYQIIISEDPVILITENSIVIPKFYKGYVLRFKFGTQNYYNFLKFYPKILDSLLEIEKYFGIPKYETGSWYSIALSFYISWKLYNSLKVIPNLVKINGISVIPESDHFSFGYRIDHRNNTTGDLMLCISDNIPNKSLVIPESSDCFQMILNHFQELEILFRRLANPASGVFLRSEFQEIFV